LEGVSTVFLWLSLIVMLLILGAAFKVRPPRAGTLPLAWLLSGSLLAFVVSVVWVGIYWYRMVQAQSSLGQFMDPIRCYSDAGCPPDPVIAKYSADRWMAVAVAGIAVMAFVYSARRVRYLERLATCPSCRTKVDVEATVCPACRSAVDAPTVDRPPRLAARQKQR
jgi:hypothetical protein